MKLSIDVATFIGRLPIGKQGENLTTQIVFDCANWLGELTGGTLSIVHQRPSDVDGYPCGNYETTDTTLTWDINETDLAFCGCGQAELRYTIGERIAKSRTFTTQILKALTPLDTPPEAYEPYIDRVIDAATREMENMTATAEAHNASSTLPSVTIEVTRVDDDHTNLNFIFDLVKGMGVGIHSANVYEDATKPSPFVEVVPYAATPAMELVDINFYNIKGEQGEPGDSIGTVTATVDSGIGTPSVEVTQSGGSGSPINVSLAFHNLKGSIDPSYLPSDHATGNPATFPDGAKDIPVDSLVADINPIQNLNGYTKPWAAGAGKNKCDNLYPDADATIRYKAANVGDGTFTMSTTCPRSPNMNYVNLFFLAGNVSSGASTNTNGVYSGQTRTVNAINGYVTFAYRYVDGTNPADYETQIESGSSATSYEPYANVCPISGRSSVDLTINGDTDSIALGQTVYGGKLNVTTGVLTIDRKLVDLGDLSWTKNTSAQTPFFYSETLEDAYKYVASQNNYISSQYTYASIGNTGSAEGMFITNTNYIRVRDLRYTSGTADAFKTAMDGVQVCYELATSTTVQLTPQEVLTVLGSNSMAADSGDVTVYYRADIGLYIDKKTA